MDSIEFEIGDDLYEVEVTFFSPATQGNRRGHPDRWTPDEGGEIELGEKVKAWVYDPKRPDQLFSDRDTVKIDLDSFVKIYAEHEWGYEPLDKDGLKAARQQLEEECYNRMAQKMEDDYDDREH